jgi:hypothetical protein
VNNHEALGKEILQLYTRGELGRVAKAEVDSLVFHYFLLENLAKPFLGPKGAVHYFPINKTEIRRLSLLAKITEGRIKTLIEKDFFLYGADEKLDDFLLGLVNATTIRSGLLKTGKIQFLVPNPIIRRFLEERIAATGGIPDSSFNREVLTLEIYDFLKLLDFTDDEMARVIHDNILTKTKIADRDPAAKAFFDELNKVPISERLKRIALGAAERLGGKASEELMTALFDLAKGKKKQD